MPITQVQIDTLKADSAKLRADVVGLVADQFVDSPNGTLVPPELSINALAVTWTIRADTRVCRDGVATNGKGQAMKWSAGSIWVQSPSSVKGFHWYEWLGPNQWRDTGSAVEP